MSSDVIIQGNSRAVHHIDPKILDSVLYIDSYNLGMDGCSFNLQYARFKIFEKYNKKPKLIIQSVGVLSRTTVLPPHFLPYIQEDLLKDELQKIGLMDKIQARSGDN